MWRGKDEVCEGGTCSPTAKPISAPVKLSDDGRASI